MTDEPTAENEVTPYEMFGGADFFESLIRAFYSRVATDPILRPLYPEEDLGPAEWRLRSFLEQYWGGPKTYGEVRGHPKLRMRHYEFHIDSVARDRWLTLMHEAVQEQNMPEAQERALWQYLVSAAFAMQNVPDDEQPNPVATIPEN